MTTPSRKVAVGRSIWVVASLAVSVLLTWYYGDRLANTPDVLAVIAAIFSILAGVLIAVVSILGDPSMIMDQSWRHSYLNARETQRKLHRHTDIFVLYVVILIVLFVYMLIPSDAAYFSVVQRVVFLLVCLGFAASLRLPFALKEIQRQRLDDAIEAKKAEVASRQG